MNNDKLLTVGLCLVIGAFVLAAYLYFPVRRRRHPSSRYVCSSNLKQIGLAMKQYAMDNKDWFPDKDGAEGFEQLRREEYLSDYKVYVCPGTTARPGKNNMPLTEATVSYVYKGGLKESGEDAHKPLAWDRDSNHENYGNILFVDGHVSGVSGSNWFLSETKRNESLYIKPKK